MTIPDSVDMSSDEVFDPVMMRSLYELGLRMAASGSYWNTSMPGRQSAPLSDGPASRRDTAGTPPADVDSYSQSFSVTPTPNVVWFQL